jgi:hypothetical protein
VALHAIDTADILDQGFVITRQNSGPASHKWPSVDSGADFLVASQSHFVLGRYLACHFPLEGMNV